MEVNGVVNLYKEKGFTSQDALRVLKGILKGCKVGHTGTLDPDATGVLPVCVGKATKAAEIITGTDKTYLATLRFGSETDTEDASGQVTKIYTYTFDEAKVREVYVSVGDLVKEGDKLMRLSDGTTITADFDGKINKVDREKGDEVNPNDSLVQVADFDHMRVSIRIGESNITAVDIGQACRVTVSSINATFNSAISAIDYASYTGNNVAYYTTTIDVDTSGVDNVYPGMQATVTIPQQEANNVVVLKMDAISTMPDNSAFVYKQDESGAMTEVPVTVGVSNGNYVEIKSGVADGETVYAVAKTETDSGMAALFSSMFGSQQINTRNQNRGNWYGGGNIPGGNNGGNNGGSNRNRGN